MQVEVWSLVGLLVARVTKGNTITGGGLGHTLVNPLHVGKQV